MTFTEALPLIRCICRKYANFQPQLDCEELVNEIWLRCDFHKFTAFTGQGLGHYIDYRIIDYLREIHGRVGRIKHSGNHPCRKVSLKPELSPGTHHAEFDRIDSEDEYQHMTSHLKPVSRLIVDMYYREGATQAVIAEELGVSESRICQCRLAILEHLRRKAG